MDPARLRALGVIKDAAHRVILLGDGKLSKRLTVVVHRASASAKARVEQAGGTVELMTRA